MRAVGSDTSAEMVEGAGTICPLRLEWMSSSADVGTIDEVSDDNGPPTPLWKVGSTRELSTSSLPRAIPAISRVVRPGGEWASSCPGHVQMSTMA